MQWLAQKVSNVGHFKNIHQLLQRQILKFFGTFTDADGNPEQNGSEWNHTFSESNGITRVHITIYNESLLRMENLLEGFKAGFTMSLENLEDLLTLLNTNI